MGKVVVDAREDKGMEVTAEFGKLRKLADSLMRGMEALKALQNERSAPWPGDSQQDGAAVDRN